MTRPHLVTLVLLALLCSAPLLDNSARCQTCADLVGDQDGTQAPVASDDSNGSPYRTYNCLHDVGGYAGSETEYANAGVEPGYEAKAGAETVAAQHREASVDNEPTTNEPSHVETDYSGYECDHYDHCYRYGYDCGRDDTTADGQNAVESETTQAATTVQVEPEDDAAEPEDDIAEPEDDADDEEVAESVDAGASAQSWDVCEYDAYNCDHDYGHDCCHREAADGEQTAVATDEAKVVTPDELDGEQTAAATDEADVVTPDEFDGEQTAAATEEAKVVTSDEFDGEQTAAATDEADAVTPDESEPEREAADEVANEPAATADHEWSWEGWESDGYGYNRPFDSESDGHESDGTTSAEYGDAVDQDQPSRDDATDCANWQIHRSAILSMAQTLDRVSGLLHAVSERLTRLANDEMVSARGVSSAW